MIEYAYRVAGTTLGGKRLYKACTQKIGVKKRD